MCQFPGGENKAWFEFPPEGPPIVHWVNYSLAGPMCHYVFDLHSKKLKIWCCDFYDPKKGTKEGCKKVEEFDVASSQPLEPPYSPPPPPSLPVGVWPPPVYYMNKGG